MLIKISTNHISWIKGEEIPYNNRVNVYEYITQLGDEGWEVAGMSGNILMSLMLKRSKQDK